MVTCLRQTLNWDVTLKVRVQLNHNQKMIWKAPRTEMKTVTICFIFSTMCSHAQNLILNGGFEEYYSCPKAPGDFEFCKYWYLANYSTPDYFRRCVDGSSAFSIPYNIGGMQEAHSGTAYAGLFLISAESSHREYIQGELSEKLRNGEKYIISFFISWGDFSSTFCDRIGFSFSEEKILPKKELRWDYPHLSKSNGCVSLELDRLKNRDSWHLVEFEYIAKGNEKFLVIGVFADNLAKRDFNKLISKNHVNKHARKKEAYFYIDDVSLVAAGTKTQFSHEIKKE